MKMARIVLRFLNEILMFVKKPVMFSESVITYPFEILARSHISVRIVTVLVTWHILEHVLMQGDRVRLTTGFLLWD
jgi:hypothetical protein